MNLCQFTADLSVQTASRLIRLNCLTSSFFLEIRKTLFFPQKILAFFNFQCYTNQAEIRKCFTTQYRCVAQLGRALRSGRRGRRFKSCRIDSLAGAPETLFFKFPVFFNQTASQLHIDAWLSLVERCVRDAEVAGSNPVASTPYKTTGNTDKIKVSGLFLFLEQACKSVRKVSF